MDASAVDGGTRAAAHDAEDPEDQENNSADEDALGVWSRSGRYYKREDTAHKEQNSNASVVPTLLLRPAEGDCGHPFWLVHGADNIRPNRLIKGTARQTMATAMNALL
jgi:hypothetical protein